MNKMFEKSKLVNKLPKDDPECSYVNSMMEMTTNLLREMCSKSGENFDKLHGVVPKCKLPIGYDFGKILLTSVNKSSHDQKDNKSSIQLSNINSSSLLPTEVDVLDSIDEKNNTVIETVTKDLLLSSDEEEYFHDDENNHLANTNNIIDSGKGDSEKIIFDTLNKCSSKIPKVHSLSLFRKHYDNNTFDNTNQTESNHNNKKDPSDDASCTGDTEPFEDSNESAKPKQQDVMKLIELLTSSKPEIKLSTFEPIYNEINRKRQAMKTKKEDKIVSQPKKLRYAVEKVEDSMDLRINVIWEWEKDINIEALKESIKKRQSVKEQTKSTNSALRPIFATQESLPFNVSENSVKRENSKLMTTGSTNQPTQNHQQRNLFGGTNTMSTTGASGNESNCVKEKPQGTAKQIFLPSNYGNSLQKVAVVTGKVNKETAVGLNSFQNQIIFHQNQHQSASQQQQQHQSHHQHQNISQQHHQQQNNQHHQNESLINNPQQQQGQPHKEQHNHQQQQKSHQQKLRQMAAKDANQRALNANENEADEQKVVEGLRAIEKLRLSIKSEFINRMRALDTEKWLREADGHKENADKVKGKLEYPPMIILAVRKYLIYNYSLDVKEQYKKCHETYLKNAEFVCQITKNLELVYKEHINKITDPNSSCLWNLKLIKWFTMTMCMKLSAILQYRAFRNVSPKCKEIHCWLRKNGILDKDGRTNTLITNSDQAVNNSPFSVLSSSYYYSPGRNSSPRGTTPAANQRGGGQSTVTGTTMMANTTTSSIAAGASGAGSSSMGSAVNFTNEMKTKLQTYIDHTGIINNSYNDWMKAEKNLATFCEKSIRHEEAWRDIEWKIIEKTGGITINGIDESMAFVIKYLEGFINYMNEFQKNLHPPRLFQFSDSNRLIS